MFTSNKDFPFFVENVGYMLKLHVKMYLNDILTPGASLGFHEGT